MNVLFDDDIDCLVYARDQLQAILLSVDPFTKGKNERGFTRTRMAQELRERGGHVLTIGGGPQQGAWRIVGKITFHLPQWEKWFADGPGRFHIGTLNPESVTARRPEQLPRGVVRVDVPQGAEYLERKERAKSAPPNPNLARPQQRRRRASAPLEESNETQRG